MYKVFFGATFGKSPLRVDGRSGVNIPPSYLLCSSRRLLLAYYIPILCVACRPVASTVLHRWRKSWRIRNGRLRRSIDHGYDAIGSWSDAADI